MGQRSAARSGDGLVLVVTANELLVRREEPHLRCLHGERYAAYAAAVGRLVPGIGRLR